MPLWRRSLKTSKLARKRRRRLLLRFAFVVILSALLIGGVVYLLNREEVVLHEIIVEGNDSLSTDDVLSFVQERLDGNYVYVIPRASIFFYHRSRIENELLVAFPKIQDVSVSLDGATSMRVRIEEREPQALWCGENRLLGAVPDCYFLDDGGFLYEAAPAFTGDIYFRFYGPLEAGGPVGQYLVPEDEFRRIFFFLNALDAANLEPVELAVQGDDVYGVYFAEGLKILFLKDQDITLVLDNLLSVLASDELREHEELNLEYIDLRFGNKVYYKFYE